jgi:hypothetical protein
MRLILSCKGPILFEAEEKANEDPDQQRAANKALSSPRYAISYKLLDKKD